MYIRVLCDMLAAERVNKLWMKERSGGKEENNQTVNRKPTIVHVKTNVVVGS